jgi:DNA-3-methyladenine glycosylase I
MSDGIVKGQDGVSRCWWSVTDPLNLRYHDDEWGRPVADDHRLFEKVCLEGFQSGLSWLTILRKRENFRRAFKGFDPAEVARFNERTVARLLDDPGIVRHRGKIEATINNARRYAFLAEEVGGLAAYVWSFEPSAKTRPKRLTRATLSQITTSTEAMAMSKDLKRRGWAFVGPTTVYAMMQAVGLVNDHLTGCPARDAVEQERARFRRPAPKT